MIRKMLLLSLFAIGLSAQAGPRIVGNGGDVIEDNPVSTAEIGRLLPAAKLSILSWLHRLDRNVQLVKERRGRNKIYINPTLAERLLFRDGQNVYGVVDRLQINFATETPCASVDGWRDGSIISMPASEICISGYSISRKLNRGNAPLQLQALILHELSHLLGANETEAVSLQRQYLSDMEYVSGNAVQNEYQQELIILGNLKSALLNQAICGESSFGIDWTFDSLSRSTNPDLFAISVLPADEQSRLDALHTLLSHWETSGSCRQVLSAQENGRIGQEIEALQTELRKDLASQFNYRYWNVLILNGHYPYQD